nr:hypothetical protein [Tanacetum cinerariifolium]
MNKRGKSSGGASEYIYSPKYQTSDFYTLYDHQVSIEGFIYWLGNGYGPNDRISSNLIFYFDLRSEEFGKVYLPYSLVHSRKLKLSKRNECLTVLEYYEEGEITVCGVWVMKDDGVTKDFTKMFTVKVPGKSVDDGVLGFRKNGEAIIEIKGQGIFEYDSSSGSVNDIGIDGDYGSFFVSSYMETLLLLDESDSIIH